MRITLIHPNLGRLPGGRYEDEGSMEPLQLAVLAALTPPEVEVVMHDDRVETIPYDVPTDLVAITVEIYTARRAYEIAAAYRRRGVPVVLGGFHPTLAPAEAGAHADAICTGDAESVWPRIVADAAAGRLRPRYDSEAVSPQAGLLPRRDIYGNKPYLPVTLIQYGRGCRFACSFCAISSYFSRRHVARAVRDVVREIEAQPRRMFFFVDDNIVADHEAAKALFRALIPLKIRWVGQASLDMTRDPELMRLMMRSGCLGHVVGFESIDAGSLEEMRKGPNLPGFDDYRTPLAVLRDHGLQLWAAFTLGHDHDTPESLRRTLEFAVANRFCFGAFNILMPYPATPLYERLASEGRHLFDGRWWLHPDYRMNHAVFRPRHMAPEELTGLVFDMKRSFHGWPSMLRRLLDVRTNLRSPRAAATFLAYNPIHRREVLKKQGMLLGAS